MLRSRIIVKGDLEQAVGAEQHAKGDKDEQHGDAEPAGKTAGGDTDSRIAAPIRSHMVKRALLSGQTGGLAGDFPAADESGGGVGTHRAVGLGQGRFLLPSPKREFPPPKGVFHIPEFERPRYVVRLSDEFPLALHDEAENRHLHDIRSLKAPHGIGGD